MLVPVSRTSEDPDPAAERICVPGAATSGLKRPPVVGPRLLLAAIQSSDLVRVPRVSMFATTIAL
jgi:hypothetical protein